MYRSSRRELFIIHIVSSVLEKIFMQLISRREDPFSSKIQHLTPWNPNTIRSGKNECYNSPPLKLDFILEIAPYYLQSTPDNLDNTSTTYMRIEETTQAYNNIPKL